MFYIASPYTHQNKNIVLQRYLTTIDCIAKFSNKNMQVYSPVVHFHEVATKHQMPTDFKFWQKHNHSMLKLLDFNAIVLGMEGWNHSVGVLDELEYIKQNKNNVHFYNIKNDKIELVTINNLLLEFPVEIFEKYKILNVNNT